MSINEIVHKALMAGIGLPEKVSEIVDELVKKGELSKSQGAKLVKECSDKVGRSGEEINKAMAELIDKALEKMNIPARDEVEKLKKKVTALSARVKKLENS
jgi:polyhydroxyalkanoate synthesis regulator phasin